MKLAVSLLLTLVACSFGEEKKNVNVRIVGGDFAALNQFPHQIAILSENQIRCGGSIIGDRFVLTAAHCVAEGLTVLAGTNSLLAGGIKVKVDKIISHENYGNFMNDIAVMRLDRPLKFTDSIQSIKLFTKEVPTGGNVTISGWGKVSNIGGISDRLQFNTLQAVSQKKCAKTSGINHKGLLCLGHTLGNGACNGDSGGSAMYDNKLVGVANFVVFGCGSSNPDGYAKVSYFVDWIRLTVAKLNSE